MHGIGPLGNYPCDAEKDLVEFEFELLNGSKVREIYYIPKPAKAIQVNSNRGSYYIQYEGCTRHWITIRYGVIDFKILSRKSSSEQLN